MLATDVSTRSPSRVAQSGRVVRDPAFDYLETITLPPPAMKNDSDAITVSVNVRPLDTRYLSQKINDDNNHIVQLARGISRLIESTIDRDIVVQIFSMNADQLGGSDVEAGIELNLHLRERGIHATMYDRELPLEGTISLIQHSDIVVAMRLHACVFALSQGVPVIGLDYSSGAAGKVAELFGSVGQSDRCFTLDSVTDEALAETMVSILG